MSRYGLLPEFKAGMHGGKVITGELGYNRREIAYMGDVLNTTARIEESCKKYGVKFLVSDFIMDRVPLPEGCGKRYIGNEELRGKSEKTDLFEVTTLTGESEMLEDRKDD